MKELEKTLILLKNFLSQYVLICNEKTNLLEKIVYEYSHKLHIDFSKETLKEFLGELKSKLNSENEFRAAFTNLGYSNHRELYKEYNTSSKKACQHVLLEYELFIANINDFSCTNFSIEHIKPDCEGGKAYLIGNMIPLLGNKNRNLAQKPYKDKISEYRKSTFTSVKNFLDRYEGDDWVDAKIENRARHLADRFFNEIWAMKVV